jgi:acyl carrier protein
MPMAQVNQDLELELKGLIADILEITASKITAEANFVEDLGMDSMMALEILASIEKRYKIKVPEENLAKIVNLKQVCDLVSELISKR